MPDIALPTINHVALTVTDLDASVRWYQQTFGISYKMDVPHPGGVGKLLTDVTWQLVLVLHRHDTNAGERFQETRTGLDHVGFVTRAA